MKVKIMKPTYDAELGFLRNNRELQVGKEIDQKTADRWISRKIAAEVIDNGGQAEQTNHEGHEAEKEPAADVVSQEVTNETEKPLTYDDYVKANKKVKPADYSEMTKQELINEAVKQSIEVKPNMTKAELIEKLIGG